MNTDLGWVEQLTGLSVVEATERTFVLSDGTQHFVDGNLVARLQVHGVIPPCPWPRAAPQDVRNLHCTAERSLAFGHDGETRTIECGKPAVIVILTEQEVWHAGDVAEDILTARPACADHEPHSSMDESEFLVLDLPT